jgi:diguanylate cyclase (GGDEF)-like protein
MQLKLIPNTSDHRARELEQELRLREREILLLKETAEAVNSQLHLDSLLQMVAEQARSLIQAETVLIPVLDYECEQYTYKAGSGRDADEIVGESLPLEFGICGWVWRNGRAWWGGVLDELEPEERNRWEKEAGTVIMTPLMGKKHFLGGISGINKVGADNFDKRDMELLSLFSSQVAIAMENALTFEKLEAAQEQAEEYQRELSVLNQELLATNRNLENMALYDRLTGLPNRNLVQDRLQQYIHQAQRKNESVAIIMIDLDRFKDVNDTLGHHVGDELLEQVGVRFQSTLRSADTIGRLGGDEFAVVLPNTDADAACLVATHLLASLDLPFELESVVCTVDASMGIAAYPQHGEDVPGLLRSADVAMYVAKRKREGYFIYDQVEDENTLYRLKLMADLRQALDRQQLQLFYQPKLDLRSGVITGVEALMRWNHPEHGFIPPDIFVPALEQTGLIKSYTYWVLEEAYSQCVAWNKAGYDLGISVNLSMFSLRDALFPGYVLALQDKWKLPPGVLTMEVTESALMDDSCYVADVLEELSRHGIQFSIDDFGTGYSSLGHLKRLPVNELKIDKSFVLDMADDADDMAIVRSTVDLAHNMGLRVVAEGVETPESLEILKELGCDQVQGYFIARPNLPKELVTLLESKPWALQRLKK